MIARLEKIATDCDQMQERKADQDGAIFGVGYSAAGSYSIVITFRVERNSLDTLLRERERESLRAIT